MCLKTLAILGLLGYTRAATSEASVASWPQYATLASATTTVTDSIARDYATASTGLFECIREG